MSKKDRGGSEARGMAAFAAVLMACLFVGTSDVPGAEFARYMIGEAASSVVTLVIWAVVAIFTFAAAVSVGSLAFMAGHHLLVVRPERKRRLTHGKWQVPQPLGSIMEQIIIALAPLAIQVRDNPAFVTAEDDKSFDVAVRMLCGNVQRLFTSYGAGNDGKSFIGPLELLLVSVQGYVATRLNPGDYADPETRIADAEKGVEGFAAFLDQCFRDATFASDVELSHAAAALEIYVLGNDATAALTATDADGAAADLQSEADVTD